MEELKSIKNSIRVLLDECYRYNVVGQELEDYVINSLQLLHAVGRDIILDQYEIAMGGDTTWQEDDM